MEKVIIYKGKPTDYTVDELGNIYSYKSGKANKLVPIENRYGYLVVNLHINKKQKQFRINRLVALAFIPNPENKPEVNHKNGNKHDNRVSNLEWNTSKENTDHAIDHGLRINKGENFHSSVLSEKDVHKICKLLEKNKLKAAEIPDKIGKHCTLKMIHNILYNNSWEYISSQYDLSKHTIDENRGPSKLTKKTVEKICKLLEKGKNYKEISKKCNCSIHVVKHIKNRHSWNDISKKYDFTLWDLKNK